MVDRRVDQRESRDQLEARLAVPAQHVGQHALIRGGFLEADEVRPGRRELVEIDGQRERLSHAPPQRPRGLDALLHRRASDRH